MFSFDSGSSAAGSKCYVTHGTMGHIDPKQPPMQRKPFSTILEVPFVHKAELILPKELYEVIQDDLFARFPTPVYSRVILPLQAIVEGDFFNEYIKRGAILMLSEGVHGIDNIYFLKDGVLTLALDKESYERAGLPGKPDGAKGKRGGRPRWIVEINLRLPAMLHGKKGFDRIIYAFKNVLNVPITWLFTDLQATVITPNPIEQHMPLVINCVPKILLGIKSAIPRLQPPSQNGEKYEDDFCHFAVDLYEWLSLVSLESPRVTISDQIDPFLSRYSPPSSALPSHVAVEHVKITWEGFLNPSWAHRAFVQTLLSAKPEDWFSFAIVGFNKSLSRGTKDCTILKLPSIQSEHILWEVEQH